MKPFVGVLAITLLTAPTVQAGDNPWTPALAASREVGKQLEMMQRAFSTIPTLGNGGRGLYGQAEQIQIALFNLRQSLKQNADRETIVVNFLKLDPQVKQLLGDLQGIDGWDAAVGYVARRLQAAEGDLHFAIMGPGANADQKAVALYRQTLVMQSRSEELQSMVKFVYLEQNVLPGWMAAMKDLRGSIDEFQRLQQKQAPVADLKAQLTKVGQSWSKLLERFNAIPEQTYWLMQSDAAQFDNVLSRVDAMLDVQRPKGKLPKNVLD